MAGVAFPHITIMGTPCKCKSPRLHSVFMFLWENPSASRKDVAEALKLNVGNVREALFQLHKRDLDRICPGCFQPSLFQGACQSCGFEPEAALLPIEARADSQSPSNALHPGNMLGTEVDYSMIGFVNRGFVMQRRIERGIEDSLVVGVKSEVENELKRFFPSEAIADEAGRLCLKEVKEFRARYPGLATSKNLRRQLAQNVVNRLRLLHPQLRDVSVLVKETAE